MKRREFVRSVVAAGLAPRLLLAQETANPAPPPPAPVPWTLGLNPLTPLPHTATADALAEANLKFFSAGQMATLRRLSELLMPAVAEKPGSLEAEAPEFLDFLIGSSPASRKQLYTGGLGWLNAEAKRRYNKPFAEVDATEGDALVKPWLRTWMTDHPPAEPHADFLNIAHADIRSATMSSKVWIDAVPPPAGSDGNAFELYWSPIEPDIYALNADRLHVRPSPVLAAPKSSHTLSSYPR